MRSPWVDPWANLHERYSPGSVHKGKVARIQPFGAFIELEEGVDGLLHVSMIDAGGKRAQHPNEVLKEAQEVMVRILQVDQHRIALAMLPEGITEEQTKQSITPFLGMVAMAKITEHESGGMWAQIEGTFGKEGRGFIAPSDIARIRGTDHRNAFPVGTHVKVKIIEINPERLELSIRAALRDEAEQAYRAYKQWANAAKKRRDISDVIRKTNFTTRN